MPIHGFHALPTIAVVAEKPSLAGEIAKVWGEMLGEPVSRGEGCWQVGGSRKVTWLIGHLLNLADAKVYDPAFASWNLEQLPIFPKKFIRVPTADKASHLKTVLGIIRSSDEIVNAGDAGREGQLLVDEVIIEARRDPFGPDIKRLWTESVTKKDLTAALSNLFPNADKRNLSMAALARQQADWTHGISLTRLFTVLGRNNGGSLKVPVGRVQSPVLKLIADRDTLIANFKPVDHFQLPGLFRHTNGKFRASWIIPDDYRGVDPEGRLIDKKVAEEVASKVAGKTGKVEAYQVTKKTKAPPLGYSLSALQIECSAKFGLNAEATLKVAQELYDAKILTYPRSDSRHLRTSILSDEAPQILKTLAGCSEFSETASGANIKIKTAIWNDGKCPEHHAIIPTTEFRPDALSRMTDIQRKVFVLIAKSFLAQFYPDYRYNSLSAIAEIEGERFKATGQQVTDNGWKVVYGAEAEKAEDENEDSQSVPVMAKGDPVTAEKVDISAKTTEPPKHYTDGTLIQDMTRIDKFETDPEIKRRLKEGAGLGTEATRAATITKLVKDTLVQRKTIKKVEYLISTEFGRSVAYMLPPELTAPGLTAVWEGYFDMVLDGKITLDQFMAAHEKTLRQRVENYKKLKVSLKGSTVDALPGHGETCQKCGKGIMITRVVRDGDHKGKKYLSCNNWRKDDPDGSCSNTVWPNTSGSITPLPGDGEQCSKCNIGRMVTRVVRDGAHKGKKYLSCNNWKKEDPNGSCKHTVWPQSEIKQIKGAGAPCPKCGKGKLRTNEVRKGPKQGQKFLGCDQYPACDHSEWPDSKDRKSSSSASSSASGSASGGTRRAGLGRPGRSTVPA